MYVKVRVVAGSKKEELIKMGTDNFRVFIRERAERNLANRRVAELIAMHYKIQVRRVRIISGHTSPPKILSIPD